MCRPEFDSVAHMLLHCEHAKSMRNAIETWIIELGMVDSHLSEVKIIAVDLENTLAINSIILKQKR